MQILYGNLKGDKYMDYEDYKPISSWGYVGYEILFAIPVVGWIIQLIFAIGHKNKNVRHFARSFYCVYVIAIVAVLLFVFLGAGM